MATRASRITFFLIFAVTGFLFYRTLRPIFTWVGMGAFCAVLTYQPYLRLARALRIRRRLAAGICTVSVMLVVVVPLGIACWQVAAEGLALAHSIQEAPPEAPPEGVHSPPARPPQTAPPSRRARVLARMREMIPVTEEQLRSTVAGLAQHAAATLTSLMSSLASIAVGVLLWVLSLYYFYLDGEGWLTRLLTLVPLPERHSIAFFREFRQVTRAVFLGNIVTAALVGIVCGVGMLIVGIPGAALLGGIIFIAAILPLVGGAFIWAPASLWLFFHGHHGAAIFLAAWCAGWSLLLDHLLRPFITQGQLEMHPLLVFLSIFGGVAAFGFAGVLLGPLFAALFLAAVRIYAAEFTARPPETPVEEAQAIVAH